MDPASAPFASLLPGPWEGSDTAFVCHTLPLGPFHCALGLKVVIASNLGLKQTTSSPVVVLGYLSQQ